MATLQGVLIGCGWISTNQLKAWATIPDVEIIALVDMDGSKARTRAREFGVANTYTSLDEALSAHELDFVDIATRPETHLQLVTQAAEAGLAVLCQKPAAPTMNEIREMVDICTARNVPLTINENGRFQPWFRAMKRHLESGAIGRPFYLNITSRWRASLPEPNFGGQPYFIDMPLLMIYEMGVHFLDTLRYLTGESTRLYAQTHCANPDLAGEDMATLMLQGEGLTSVVDMSWASVPVDEGISWGEFKIEGKLGTLHLGLDGILRVIGDKGVTSEESFPDDSVFLGFCGAQQHFVDSLKSDEASETSGIETLKTMELVFGAYESASTGSAYQIGKDIGRLK